MGQCGGDFCLSGWVGDVELKEITVNRKCFLLSVLIFAVGCTSTAQHNIIPSQTPSITVSMPTLTSAPTHTLIPSLSPTWTLLPTIPPDDLQQVILDLIVSNGECEYPCWLGIRPGITDWHTAKAFLNTLSPTYWQPETKDFTTVTLPLPDNWSSSSEGSAKFYVRNGIVSSINAFTYFSIADMLSKYGQPNEIWVEYHEDELLAPHYSFYISLGYLDKGFVVNYFRQVLHDDKNHICPYRDLEPEILTDGFGKVHTIDHHISPISVWNPLEQKTFTEIIAEHHPSWNEFYVFRPLNEITNLDVNQFVDIYKDSNTHTCIEVVH
jgi:hypothetical protein